MRALKVESRVPAFLEAVALVDTASQILYCLEGGTTVGGVTGILVSNASIDQIGRVDDPRRDGSAFKRFWDVSFSGYIHHPSSGKGHLLKGADHNDWL